MTDYTWNGLVSTDASVAGNWTPSGVPTTGDKAIFDVSGGTQPCTFNITALDEIEIKSDNASIITFTVDVSLTGLSVSVAGTMAATAPVGITFTGTPLYKSGLCYIEIGTASSPFNNTVSRGHFTFTLNPSTGNLYFDTGIYPNVKLGGAGNKTPQYVAPTVANSTDVNFLTLRISAGTFAPASATPTDNDKAKSFIIDSSSSQFTIDASGITSFNGGYATWTFQAASSGFLIPTSNLTEYQGCNFTFQKMSIVATSDGAGAWAKIAANSRLYLTDFTIGVGASVKGAGASAIHLINRPTIKGTWGFFPIADGIYHHKDGEVLGVANGGTGLANVNQYYIPFGSDGNTLTTSANFTFDNSSNELTIDGKLTVTGLIDPTGMVFTPQASNPETTNPQNTIYISDEDGHLWRGDRDVESTVHFNVRNDEGSTIPLGAPLYSKGEIGGSNRIKVGIADASDPNKMPCIGLAMQEMNTTSTKDGNMILLGIFNENITITGVAEGDIIYVAPHGGSTPYLTTTRPTGGSHLIQNICICVRQSVTNISQGMTVSAIGRTNDIPNATITTNSADADYVYIDDGNVFKKITPSNLGIGGGGSGTVTSIATSAPITGGVITSTGTIGISAATTSAAGSMSSADKTKLDALASPFQHLRVHLTNNALATQSAGTAYYLDLANTSNYTSTGNTTDIVITDDTQDYISLGAGGMYMVVASIEMFTASGTAAQDFWLQLGNGTSSNAERRRWGTARFKVKATQNASDCAINMQKTVIIDVASGGSDEKLYVIPQVNGVSFEVKAYDNNRTNITITRIGASTS